jgi:hypothetical protein
MTDSEDTLLSKFYGIYTISMENMQDITCFIMDNLLGEDFMNIERIYDLKGSTVGRIVKLKKDQQERSGLKVLKDLNFCELKERMDVGAEVKERLIQVMERDSQFLASQGLMDYSVLFIKRAKKSAKDISVMPAMVCVNDKDGTC